MKTIGVVQLLQKNFISYGFSGKWLNSFGDPEKNFTAIIYGDSGNGKTSFCVQFAKYLSDFSKVLYISQEEGIKKTMKDAFILQKMEEVSGRVILGEKFTVADIIKYMKKRNSPQVCFIDSVDRMRLKYEEFLQILEACPKKTFIFVAWSKGKEPNTAAAKKIEYDVDIKIHVHQWRAFPRSRFGGNQPFLIWDKANSIPPPRDLSKEETIKTEHILEQENSEHESKIDK
jgi:GTPase SAR1 family protein